MKTIGATKAILSAGVLSAGCAWGQTIATNAQAATHSVPSANETKERSKWSFAASAYTYI